VKFGSINIAQIWMRGSTSRWYAQAWTRCSWVLKPQPFLVQKQPLYLAQWWASFSTNEQRNEYVGPDLLPPVVKLTH